ncbi:hypothetical protein [Pseudonocardia spirodelae]|uniref:Uncharacterized protein n=1 Tax=Pseudonocardia spirodelae TaxID=3133431 RepID=A0ABU8T9J1_9PSEU
MRPDLRRDPDALDRAADALSGPAAALDRAAAEVPDPDRALRLRRVAEELTSLAAAARRAAATTRAADGDAARGFTGLHDPARPGA